jgi:hypothetical protein
MLRSPLFHPFRSALRPLLRWTFKSHLFVYDEERPDSPIGVNLKPLSIVTLVLAVLIGPLVFVMLLPLVLILMPVALLFGMLGVATTSAQTDDDDSQHHTLLWHALH